MSVTFALFCPVWEVILSVSSDDYWKLTTSCCITVLPNSAVTVFNLVFLPYTHSMTVVMPPGLLFCIGHTKYPHCIILYCNTYVYSVYAIAAFVRRETFPVHISHTPLLFGLKFRGIPQLPLEYSWCWSPETWKISREIIFERHLFLSEIV